MYQDNFFNELIIDNFAGGGGASVGIELATGRPVDIAVNHDEDAIAMHSVNHPYTQHFQEDVFAIDPEEVTGGRPVGIAWFSPDCKHFSRAKGNKPVEHKIRGLSWVIIKWAMSSAAPRCIFMENVEEIQTWGPLIYVEGKEISETERTPGSWRPDPERSGETFKAFVGMLSDGVAPDCPALEEACEFLRIERGSADEQRLIKGLGYKVEYKVLRACDYGAPTIRKRFYLIARNDGKPIVFPSATHGKGKGLKPYRTAAECIDWSIPCPSIFERKKPLVKNTLRRVARGLDKFVIKNPKPYILEMNFDNPFQDIDKPMSTQTSANHHYLITPELVQVNHSGDSLRGQKVDDTFPTITQKHGFGVATPVLVECSHKNGPGVHGVDAPMNTQTGKACFAVETPFLTPIGYGENKKQAPRVNSVNEPVSTVVSSCKQYLTAPALLQYHSEQSKGEVRGQKITEPIMTVDGSPRYAVNGIYISKYFGGEGAKASGASFPLPTVTAKDHNSLCASNLCVLRKNMDGKSLDDPMPTLTTSAGHFAEIRTYLLPVDSTQDLYHWNEVRKLLNEYADYSIKENEILIIEIAGIPYFIGDIGMRMLKAEELKLAQGFPVDYIIDIERHIGKKYSEAKQIARLGNAVCPPVATALIRANCADMAYKRKLTTVAQLERAICGA
ncbi:MAG: DNA cytosine methyltransferase [Clostridia bacterium]|nr:DNA cytosine methyltransferase [Clostridia bacterium]